MNTPKDPHNRPDHGPERDRQIMLHKTRQAMQQAFDTVGLFRNCITCRHFIEHMETCELAGKRPPPRVIAYGCEAHSEEIPF